MSLKHGYVIGVLVSLCWGCNTTTMNSLSDSSGGTEGTPDTADAGGSDGSSSPIELVCERYFACGEAAEGFDQASCEQLGLDCRSTLETANPGSFDPRVDACLGAQTCADFDTCFGELVQECSAALGGGGGCNPDTDLPACAGEQIGACVEGQWQTFDCVDVCAQDGSSYDSCSYDSESGHDVCWCVSGGADPATCELGVNALCTCYDCTTQEAQSLYDTCVQQGDDVLLCYADQVVDDQIACAEAEQACDGA